MKMSDVFQLPVTAHISKVKLNVGFSINCLNIECDYGRDCDTEKHAHHAAHAINNHDRMADEIAELREALGSLCEPAFEYSELVRNAPSLGWLSEKVKRDVKKAHNLLNK